MSVSLSVQHPATPHPAAVLELLKPVTWFPPMWAFACGAIAAGGQAEGAASTVFLGVLVAGPLVCGTSQVVNDWFDREVDAINEPGRPIPSGRVPGRWGLGIALTMTALSALVGWWLGPWGFGATLVALVLAWLYSAPPFRLKKNGWIGNAAVGLSYESLAWITGMAVVLGGAAPTATGLAIAVLYGLGAHGIMTLNDFKSMDGDRRLGIGSLPARLGPERAAWVACVVMAVAQVAVAVVLGVRGHAVGAALVAVLLLLQLPLMRRFLANPVARAQWISARGVSLYVLGMMASAIAIRGG